MKEVHLLVSGVVQGVGFRHFVNRLAHQLDIKGEVCNLPDGRVEVIAQGEGLEAFVAEVKRGPGRVDSAEESWSAPKKRYLDFSVSL